MGALQIQSEAMGLAKPISRGVLHSFTFPVNFKSKSSLAQFLSMGCTRLCEEIGFGNGNYKAAIGIPRNVKSLCRQKIFHVYAVIEG